jgi:hypothetical protein
LPDHVLLALDNLGFGEYKEDCVEVMKQMQEEVDKRKKLRHRLEKPDIPEEELLRQQNLLFAEARKQQEMIDNAEDWSRMQQEAQLALQRQSSNSNPTTSTLPNNNQNSDSTSQYHTSSNNNNNNNDDKSTSKILVNNSNADQDDDDNYD